MSGCAFLYVPMDRVRRLWPYLCPYLRSALKHTEGEYVAEDLLALALCAQVQLWAAVTERRVIGAACTQVMEYPRRRILHVIALAGERFDEWVDLCVSESAAFARHQGCDLVRVTGRPGWTKRLHEFGYAERYRQVDLMLE